MASLQSLPQVVTAIGGLGAAAFELVDASKTVWGVAQWPDRSCACLRPAEAVET